MKAIYFADCFGDLQEEKRNIQRELHRNGIDLKIIAIDTPPKENYDIMFFDWGGMSVGNNMLEHFCEHWIEDAREHPSRIYVMASTFTKNAMEDLRGYEEREIEEFPKNIFMSVEAAIPFLKELLINKS